MTAAVTESYSTNVCGIGWLWRTRVHWATFFPK